MTWKRVNSDKAESTTSLFVNWASVGSLAFSCSIAFTVVTVIIIVVLVVLLALNKYIRQDSDSTLPTYIL